jgi:4-amino-4-deoxy-L-arabinose transferase-like glycosyltransferase
VAGAATGLAFTSKYTTSFVALAVAVPLLARNDLSRQRRAWLAVTSSVAAVVAAVVSMPRLVLRTAEVLDAIRETSDAYAAWDGGIRYVDEVVTNHEIGVAVLVLGLIGTVLLVVERRSRATTLGYLAFAAVTGVNLAGSSYQPFRNVLPLIPFLCIGAAGAVVAGGGLLDRALPSLPRAGRAISTAAFALVCVNFALGWGVPYARDRSEVVDSRVEARRYLEQRVGAGDEVVVASELGLLPSELDLLAQRTGAQVTSISQNEPLSGAHADAAVVVSGSFEDGDAWQEALDDREELARFGTMLTSCEGLWFSDTDRDPRCPTRPYPDAWHQNDGIVVIHGGRLGAG